ncbi:carboxypeptidase-like regulatory domain-containing protein [bacterium]|nr:carboxypeptidase-like regulatory domain-containing protein [bacterium]
MTQPRRWILWTIFIAVTSVLQAGTTGKIKGIVLDGATGDPLMGANILIENTIYGAAADMDGNYLILNVPPGKYTLRATMIGYNPLRIENVNVSVDFTTEMDFELGSTVLETGESVTITAERQMVVRDLTATTAVVGAEEIAALPVTEVSEAVELQAGLIKDAGGGIHVRGGRSGEISYWIDGIPVTDVYDGGTVVDVNKDMVQELQVVSGAFNAEYGQAMSGIVNITTKEGSNDFGGSFSTYFGDYVSRHDEIFTGIDKINPVAIRNFEGGIHGPLIKDKLFFYVNARQIYFDGWLQGERKYNPNAVTSSQMKDMFQDGAIIIPPEYIADFFPEYAQDTVGVGSGEVGFNYVLGTNSYVDSAVVMQGLMELYRNVDPDSFSHYYEKYVQSHSGAKGDRKIVPMNWNRKLYLQGKLIYRLSPSIKLSYNYILDNVDYEDYDRNFLYNPDGNLNRFREGQTHIFQVTHTLNPTTFYNLGFSNFSKTYKHYVYENVHDPGYIHPFIESQQPYSFKTGGTNNSHFSRETQTWLAKFDITSQVTRTHQMKLGLEYRKYLVEQHDITLRPADSQSGLNYKLDSPYITTRVMPDSTVYASEYTHRPGEISGYLQDKMEFKNMIVNVGIRMDYFQPDGVVLRDESDPTIYKPIKAENRYRDVGTDGIPDTYDPDGTEGNGRQDPGEPSVTVAERQSYWYKDASGKIQISPRLGVSFPVTDRGIFHFSYGHFFQIPRFERLYQNPDFELDAGTGNLGVIGNADLKPEQTISGEIGLQQQVSEDIAISITGYFRDIRDLAGTNTKSIKIFGSESTYNKIINSDFGLVKGMILAVNKRFSQNWSASLDYTLQSAKASNSDPEQARNASSGGAWPEIQLTPLDWDQKHTVNASFTYGGPSWGTSVIAQWGSGLPFTPPPTEDISVLQTNSQRKPSAYNVDLRAYKDFKIRYGTLTLFCRILNVFDTLNEINVYDDTGRAGFTTYQLDAAKSNPSQFINSLDQWYNNATHYSEPRRIEVGVSMTVD